MLDINHSFFLLITFRLTCLVTLYIFVPWEYGFVWDLELVSHIWDSSLLWKSRIPHVAMRNIYDFFRIKFFMYQLVVNMHSKNYVKFSQNDSYVLNFAIFNRWIKYLVECCPKLNQILNNGFCSNIEAFKSLW